MSQQRLCLFPLQKEIVAGFIRFLGLEAKYAIGSIEDVIVPALKRLHVENTDEAVPLEVTKFISQAVRDLKNSKSPINKPDGKEAAIISDVRRVIDECTPDGLPTKASEASLWLTD